MKKYTLLFCLLIFFSFLSFSHEFWLQPLKFLLKINEHTSVDVFVGENYTGEKVDASKFTISKLTHYSKEGEADLKSQISTKDSVKIPVTFSSEGNHLLAFNNTNKFIQLDAKKFNEYLRSEGLDNIVKLRKEKGLENKKGREFYQRCVKTLFQVGETKDETFSKNTGMRLEIIPTMNPYLIKSGDFLTFKVLFDNEVFSNALVLAWQVNHGKTSMKKLRSNAKGEVSFPITKAGRWMISTVRMIPHTAPAEADYQSFWGSYTFGYY